MHVEILANTVLLVGSTFLGAASAKDCSGLDTTKPFQLSAVTKNGTIYPLAVGEVSRGVSVLSTAGRNISPGTFVLDSTGSRVAPVDQPTLLSGEVRAEQPFTFLGTNDFDPLLVYIQKDCKFYLVKGTSEAGTEVDIYSWTSSPPSPEGLVVEIYYHGNGANSAIRVES